MNFNAKSTGAFKLAYLGKKTASGCDQKCIAYADGMVSTMLDVMNYIKNNGLLFKRTAQNGNEVDISAVCDCDFDDVQNRYYNKARISVGNQSLIFYGGTTLVGGKVRLSSMGWSVYNPNTQKSTYIKGNDEIQKSRAVNVNLKKIADLIANSDFLNVVDSEIAQFAIHLNKDLFTAVVPKRDEDGNVLHDLNHEPVMCKAVYAIYNPAENGYNESVSIWNRLNDYHLIVVTLMDSDNYGHSCKVTNFELTDTELDGVQPRDCGDTENKPLFRFVNNKDDAENFLPPVDSIFNAVAEWLGKPMKDPKDVDSFDPVPELETEEVPFA